MTQLNFIFIFAAFGVGHTCNAMTMGVWIMCVPHPTQESQVLVLLDTEGIGAVLEVCIHFKTFTQSATITLKNEKNAFVTNVIWSYLCLH